MGALSIQLQLTGALVTPLGPGHALIVQWGYRVSLDGRVVCVVPPLDAVSRMLLLDRRPLQDGPILAYLTEVLPVPGWWGGRMVVGDEEQLRALAARVPVGAVVPERLITTAYREAWWPEVEREALRAQARLREEAWEL